MKNEGFGTSGNLKTLLTVQSKECRYSLYYITDTHTPPPQAIQHTYIPHHIHTNTHTIVHTHTQNKRIYMHAHTPMSHTHTLHDSLNLSQKHQCNFQFLAICIPVRVISGIRRLQIKEPCKSILTAPVIGSCPFLESFFNKLEISDKSEGTEPNSPSLYSFLVWGVFGGTWLQVAVSSKSKTKKRRKS